jgi:hypothetical protein
MDELFRLEDPDTGTSDPKNVPSVASSSTDIHVLTTASLNKPDTKASIYGTPIVLVKKEPTSVSTIRTLQSLKDTGVSDNDVLAINGEAASLILNNPSDSGPLTSSLYLLPPSPPYTDVKQLPAEQVCFIALFHHLHCLAVVHSISGVPGFSDSFKEKFEFLQRTLDTKEMTAFGVDVTTPENDLTVYWSELQESATNKRTVYQIIEYIKSGPKEVYKYITGTPEPTEPEEATGNTSTEAGFANMESVAGTVKTASTVESAREKAIANMKGRADAAVARLGVTAKPATAAPAATAPALAATAPAPAATAPALAATAPALAATAPAATATAPAPAAAAPADDDADDNAGSVGSVTESVASSRAKELRGEFSTQLQAALNRNGKKLYRGSPILYKDKPAVAVGFKGDKDPTKIGERHIMLKTLEDNRSKVALPSEVVYDSSRIRKSGRLTFKRASKKSSSLNSIAEGGRRNTRKKNRKL